VGTLYHVSLFVAGLEETMEDAPGDIGGLPIEEIGYENLVIV
jgi:hypothetical protein